MAEKYVAATNIKIDGELIERGEVVTASDLKTESLKGQDNLEALIAEGSVITEAAYHQAFPNEAPVDADEGDAEQIITDARAEAEKILAEANTEAEKIKADAQAEAEKASATTAAGKDAGKATDGSKK